MDHGAPLRRALMDRVKRIMIILSAVTLCALILSAVILSGAGPWTIGLFVVLSPPSPSAWWRVDTN